LPEDVGNSEILQRKEKRTARLIIICFLLGIMLVSASYLLFAVLVKSILNDPFGAKAPVGTYLALSQVLGVVGSSLIAGAFILVVYWAHSRDRRKGRRAKKILVPRR